MEDFLDRIQKGAWVYVMVMGTFTFKEKKLGTDQFLKKNCI